MAIKMIAIDLDGTLLTSANTISAETLKTLGQVHNQGIKIVLASGRPLSGILDYTKQLGLAGENEYAVVFNGAVVQNLAGKVLMSQEMDYRDFNLMLRLQRLSHVNLHFETTECFWTLDRDLCVQMQINAAFTNNEIKVRDKKEIPQDFVFNKVGFTCPKGSDQIAKLWGTLPDWAFQSYDIVRSLDNCIELNAIGASKGNAVMDLAERLKINQKDVMIFGDQGNDVSMFENPEFLKVAMGNAIEDIKKRADFVTDDNDHNGVAKALKKFVL
ncbi:MULTISPECIES: Cof-type HAD-IIB family hydrolase [Lactobacillus]|uniref:HAD family phosphatase n=1 Tax=Lactobacillus xujianguonis TaxID=2495899 RepID=A0A437SW71_9LACO|nr:MULTISPECIES: Cof-type HAD-IIB family hydrolase [Lactobacillus]RVU71178.1 HAD family phosphatase [Lactobacillus xujianguonis]RVU74141.1 HAD family phosphatase [Lactobacillus xujianguonis]